MVASVCVKKLVYHFTQTSVVVTLFCTNTRTGGSPSPPPFFNREKIMEKISWETITKAAKKENVRNYLDLSTGHAMKEDFNILNDLTDKDAFRANSLTCNSAHFDHGEWGLLMWILHDHGAWIHVPDDPDYYDESIRVAVKIRLSKNFINCMKLAYCLGCFWIKFDSDAPYIEGLPKGTDWE